MSVVVIADAAAGLAPALEAVFKPYGGLRQLLADSGYQPGGTVYIKPNGVHFSPHTYTDSSVLAAVLAYFRDHGFRRLAVMESSTGGNFTRLVFAVNGYAEVCRRFGAEAVYLDEGPIVPVDLRDGTRARISRRLYREVIQRDGNFYLSLPKLKTHSMSIVTLGVKNQQAFPVDADRMINHNQETLHARLAALYNLVRPDFCLIEGLTATAHGHFPATALLDESLVAMNLLVGGPDTLAVDVVGARLLGYRLEEVEHLRLCAEWGLGQGNLEEIEVLGLPLENFRARLPHTLLRRLHLEVRWVVGREKACMEGCLGNSQAIQEVLYNDYGGRGGWSLVCGSGFQPEDLQDLSGDILVVGPCACDEAGPILRRHYPDQRIYYSPEHNDLMTNTRWQARLMGVRPLRLVPLNPLRILALLAQARLNGLQARIPPPFG